MFQAVCTCELWAAALHSHFGMPKTKLKQRSAHWWKGGAVTYHIQSEEKSHQILVMLLIDSSAQYIAMADMPECKSPTSQQTQQWSEGMDNCCLCS